MIPVTLTDSVDCVPDSVVCLLLMKAGGSFGNNVGFNMVEGDWFDCCEDSTMLVDVDCCRDMNVRFDMDGGDCIDCSVFACEDSLTLADGSALELERIFLRRASIAL